MLATAAPANGSPTNSDIISGFRCASSEPLARANWGLVQDAYMQRSLAIIAASLTNNTGLLRAAVAQNAKPVHFFYDAGFINSTGPESVAALIRSIDPTRYELVQERGLPPPIAEPCGEVDISLTLRGSKPNEAYVARFRYRSGLLSELNVQDADFADGQFPKIRGL